MISKISCTVSMPSASSSVIGRLNFSPTSMITSKLVQSSESKSSIKCDVADILLTSTSNFSLKYFTNSSNLLIVLANKSAALSISFLRLTQYS